ncbi:MAG TPA: transglycosylase SLT domain-containing protein [Usitatibacter sp.]|nr:transglycosylase SLT domain-containing protein [Usitatibacter sp.]
MPCRRRKARAAVLALALAFAAGGAHGGAQKYELLSASVRTALAQAVADRGTFDMSDMELRVWVRAMTPRAQGWFPEEDAARRFLALVRYEALRAGLDPQLVLAVIQVESRFRKYAVSRSGARGLMQVMPFWVQQIGAPGQDLFQERTNLRYGCTIRATTSTRNTATSRTRSAATTARWARRTIRTGCSRHCASAGRSRRFPLAEPRRA